jgi:REP element-mobilizing transposase RayT
MPRGPRLDAPNALHHVILRGIERRQIFRSDSDRHRCLDRLGAVVIGSGAGLYAWCLMPNHIHVLIRTGRLPLGRLMQRWAGPYASEFNRRYARAGHLFQNRFKSIVVDEEQYLLELVRYIHLNPVRARLSVGVDELDSYPWTGHAVLLGTRAFPAQDADSVLERFGPTYGGARRAYREFIRAAAGHHAPVDLSGGGLRRSAGGWRHVPTLGRGRERWAHDERILGSGEFVQRVIGQGLPAPALSAEATTRVRRLSGQVADRLHVTAAQIASPSLRRPVLEARAIVCHLAVCHLGLTLQAVGRALGISKQSVSRAIDRAPPLISRLTDLDDLLS